MNYRNIYCTLIIGCICSQINANPMQTGLNLLLAKSDSLNAQLSIEARKTKGNAGEQIQKMTDEVCFYSMLRITLVRHLMDSMLLISDVDLDNAFEGIIRYEESLVGKIRLMAQKSDSIINKTNAKSMGALTDSLFYSFDNVDIALKNKIDSLYVNAISIKNQSKTREIILGIHPTKETIICVYWIVVGLALLILILVTIKYRLKSRRILSYILIGVLLLMFILLVNPLIIDGILGKKAFVPGWEYYTLAGHKQNGLFMKQSKEKLSFTILSETASLAFSCYYKAASASVNTEQVRELYKEISYISSVLYPPALLLDSATIAIKEKIKNFQFCYNPAWFSTYNYTKINAWNRMIGRGNVQGNTIRFESYNATLNYLLKEDFKLEELKENWNMLKSPAKRMKLDLLLKVKAVL